MVLCIERESNLYPQILRKELLQPTGSKTKIKNEQNMQIICDRAQNGKIKGINFWESFKKIPLEWLFQPVCITFLNEFCTTCSVKYFGNNQKKLAKYCSKGKLSLKCCQVDERCHGYFARCKAPSDRINVDWQVHHLQAMLTVVYQKNNGPTF